jgi:predicted lipoprotein with Yx(FWY)xxD motif
LRKLFCAVALAAGLLSSGCGGDTTSPVAGDEAAVSPTSEYSAMPSEPAMPSEAAPPPPPTGPANVRVAKTNLGDVLVGLKDRTVYMFEKDEENKSNCTGPCALAWPPFLTLGDPQAGPGVKQEWIDVIERENGVMQVTYKKRPLYYYVQDLVPGDTKGHDVMSFDGEWYAITPEGKKAQS